LERLSSLLLRSLEAIADEGLGYSSQSSGASRVYVPVIVTNATLLVCRFDPAQTDLSAGRIDDADFEPVKCVRFRKNFSSTTSLAKPQEDLKTSNRYNERTIFVINSGALADTLGRWDMSYQLNAPWPWEEFR
jgi:hypothetical protein